MKKEQSDLTDYSAVHKEIEKRLKDKYLATKKLLDILNYKDEDNLNVAEMITNANKALNLIDKYENIYEFEWDNNNIIVSQHMHKALSLRQLQCSNHVSYYLKNYIDSVPLRLLRAYQQIYDCIDDYSSGQDENHLVTINEYVLFKILLSNFLLVADLILQTNTN